MVMQGSMGHGAREGLLSVLDLKEVIENQGVCLLPKEGKQLHTKIVSYTH